MVMWIIQGGDERMNLTDIKIPVNKLDAVKQFCIGILVLITIIKTIEFHYKFDKMSFGMQESILNLLKACGYASLVYIIRSYYDKHSIDVDILTFFTYMLGWFELTSALSIFTEWIAAFLGGLLFHKDK
jgi:hypothetical protein